MDIGKILEDMNRTFFGSLDYQQAVRGPDETEPDPVGNLTVEKIREVSRRMMALAGPPTLESIGRHRIVSWDMAQPGAEVTVAYRMEHRDGRHRLEPVSAEEMSRFPLSLEPLITGRTPSRTDEPHVPECRQCGQSSEHFFTSQRDQSVLCEACFGERETKQLAKQVTKSKHPLDAWME